MDSFSFHIPTQIIFGKGVENSVGSTIAKLQKSKVLLHYGGGSIKSSGLYDRVVKSLSNAGIGIVELGGVQPNPRVSKVREGIALCRQENVDFILAVGGGSVIDSAKAIGIGVPYEGDVWDFYDKETNPSIEATLPVGVILTIPAAGSEGSAGSVITNEEKGLKRDTGSELMRPAFAMMNPQLAFSLPPYQAACGMADILAHVMERYFTPTQHVAFTDSLAEATMCSVVKNAPHILSSPSDYDAWADMMLAGTLAHNDLLSVGRVGDWASHMIEHELSGLYDIAHGAGLAVVFPAWMKYVYQTNVARFVQFAVKVFNVPMDDRCPERTALAGIQELEAFFHSMGLPVTAQEIGLKTSDIQAIADAVVKDPITNTVGHFVALTKEDIIKILELTIA